MKPTAIFLAGALAAVPARSEDTRMVLSAGLLVAQGNTLDLTQKKYGGFTAEVGLLFSPKDLGVQVLPYIGLNRFPAANPTATQPTYTIDSPRFGFDLVYRPWDRLPMSLRTGPAFHIWQVDQKDVPPPTAQGDQNIKLGWRTGLAWDVNDAWSVSLYYTFSEWRADPNLPYQEGWNPSRPAYFSVLASYRF